VSEPPVHLDGGLTLRRATAGDAERIAEFNGEVHRDPGQAEPNAWIAGWARSLATRPHPTFSVGDFLLVEDAGGRVVSSVNLISQTWSFGGIDVKVGTPELVGTLEEYRGRGLVRRQMDVLHRWSAERGELVQAINGIPFFYRQFGYEMALDLGGGRVLPRTGVPKLKDGEGEPFRVRPAGVADVPFVEDVDRSGRRRWLVSAVRDQALWRYELDGKSGGHMDALAIVETGAGEPVGFVAHWVERFGGTLGVVAYELREGASWLAATPTVLRYLAERGAAMRPFQGEEPFEELLFNFGSEHPIYRVARDRMTRVNPPYAFYVRVPDLPAFVRHIAPVLERRLADSVAPGYGGELKLSFYRDGLRLRFEGGRLTEAESFRPPQRMEAGAWFPDLTFLQLLFGRRSLDELKHAFPDVYTRGDEAAPLLEALFPKQSSRVWAVN
jgi:hypothetical protein